MNSVQILLKKRFYGHKLTKLNAIRPEHEQKCDKTVYCVMKTFLRQHNDHYVCFTCCTSA